MILVIETSADNCSVAIAGMKGECVAFDISEKPFSHAESLPVMVEEILIRTELKVNQLLGVAINSGPGSYTGLRIGTSLAKGICYASGMPLIALSGLRGMASEAQRNHAAGDFYISNMDARRDEFYMQEFDHALCPMNKVHPQFTNEAFYYKYKNRRVVFCGNANAKIQESTPENSQFVFFNTTPKAMELCLQASEKYLNGQFEDLAYFEPFYLKSFVPQAGEKTT